MDIVIDVLGGENVNGKYLYHATKLANLESILKVGLEPRRPVGFGWQQKPMKFCKRKGIEDCLQHNSVLGLKSFVKLCVELSIIEGGS